MPIKGLTDRQPSFPRIGELRKGAEKPAKGPGRDLSYFRFTSKDGGAVARFRAVYQDEPDAINVYLPYATADENFEAWQEEWVAGGLKHRCDGERVVLLQQNGQYIQPDNMRCPGGCKQAGRLKVIIPELARLAYVVALTSSTNDIMELSANLAAIQALRGDLRGIPFILSRVPRMISTPETDKQGNPTGKRVRREKYLLHIEAAPEWVQAQLTVMRHNALPGSQQALQLTSGGDAVDVDTGEIVEIEAEYEEVEQPPTTSDRRGTMAPTEQAKRDPRFTKSTTNGNGSKWQPGADVVVSRQE